MILLKGNLLMNYSAGQKLSGTALGLSIFALISTLIFPVVLPLVLGSTAIILAILSKGGGNKLPGRSHLAVILAVMAIAVNIIVLIVAAVSFANMLQDPSQREALNSMVESTYGMSLDELLGSLPSFMGGTQ